MTTNALMAYAIALLAAAGVFAVIMGLFANNKTMLRQREMDELIENITKSEIESQREEANIPNPKTWSGYWYALGSSAGIVQTSPSRTGAMAAGFALVSFFVGTFAYPREALIGAMLAIAVLFAFRIFLVSKANKRLARIDEQLTDLLSGMRANLSANMTPQQAILSQVGEIPAPLGDELRTLKGDLDVNIPLDAALESFAQRVPSRELHFLVSSMRIAISQGANLDQLLETLQGIIIQRAGVRNKLASAIAQAQPAIYVTALAIPLGLIFSFSSDEKNRDFWLSFNGLLAFGVIMILYIASLVAAQKQIKKVKEA
jgi:tight adherence protein B